MNTNFFTVKMRQKTTLNCNVKGDSLISSRYIFLLSSGRDVIFLKNKFSRNVKSSCMYSIMVRFAKFRNMLHPSLLIMRDKKNELDIRKFENTRFFNSPSCSSMLISYLPLPVLLLLCAAHNRIRICGCTHSTVWRRIVVPR